MVILIICCAHRTGAHASDALVVGFLNPPTEAKPQVWWHWIDGNVTKVGVRLDVEWMKRTDIGGVTHIDMGFDGLGPAFETSRRVANPLVYLTPEWDKVFQYSVGIATELGLEYGIASAPGWNTGGFWVAPRQGMKKLVWSETHVRGGRRFDGRLATPPQTTGPFQDIPKAEFGTRQNDYTPVYYADVATIAYRASATEDREHALTAWVTSSAGRIDARRLAGGDLATALSLPFEAERDAWVQFSFAERQTIRGLTTVIGHSTNQQPREGGWLEASEDGHTFRHVCRLPNDGAPQQTVTFAPVVARILRVVLERPESNVDEQIGVSPPQQAHQVAEIVLHTAARVNRFEDKAGYSTRQITDADDSPAVAPEDVVRRRDIINLTDRLGSDGHLDWAPPSGHWIVLRFGYSLTGSTNFAGPRGGRGLEVDKLSRPYVKAYFDTYLARIEEALGKPLGSSSIGYMLSDSYEAGPQNWTDDMLQQFSERRGYDALPWLPVLAGRVVESASQSDRFLWDFRSTLGELMADAHYGQMAASVHQRGLRLYAESQESGRAFIGDGMEVKKTADVPMGAIWATTEPGVARENYDADIRESASVSHIYGKRVTAGESFTNLGNTYELSPETLKPIADRALTMGLNRFVIHCSVHQPDSEAGPGLTLGPFGIWFTRKETWAEQAAPWIRYLARSSYLLQQGRFVADIAYLYGEDTNVTSLFHRTGPTIPEGYSFDFVNPGALEALSVRDRKIVTVGGMQYDVLALDPSTRRLSVPALRRIRALVRAGAIVVGAKPTQTPSLADDESEFRSLVAELWPANREVLGNRVQDQSLEEVLKVMHIDPDVRFSPQPLMPPRFVHRALDEGDLYFLSSESPQTRALEVDFRVSGKAPELWRADTGMITPLSYRTEHGRTVVPLKLGPNDAVFVVFRHSTMANTKAIADPVTEPLATLGGTWDVSFPPNLGAPAHSLFSRLESWTESGDAEVRYFSGTAVYHKMMTIDGDWLKSGAHIQLDLGGVKNLAEVVVNGRSVGILWKPPFACDITDALKRGDNTLEIRVTNLWPNRLIGDKQPGSHPVAFASFDAFESNLPLLPSGLLGPVTLSRVSIPPNDSDSIHMIPQTRQHEAIP